MLVALALGLGAYIYFVESKRDPTATEARDRVFTVETSAIEEVTLQSATGQTTTVRKTGTEWQIVAPVVAAAGASVGKGSGADESSAELVSCANGPVGCSGSAVHMPRDIFKSREENMDRERRGVVRRFQ